MNKESLREVRNIALITAITVLFLVYTEKVIGFTTGIFNVTKPFLVGIAIAFVLNIPIVAIEDKVFAKFDNVILSKLKRPVSIILSILIVVSVVTIVALAVIPQIASTIADIGRRLPGFVENVMVEVDLITKNYPEINEWIDSQEIQSLDWMAIIDNIIDFFKNGVAGSLVLSTVNMASSIASFLLNAFIAICFAIYILANKERVLGNIKTVFKTYLPRKKFDYLYHATMVLSENFKKFIAGQCLEAIILGCIFAVVMTILRLPYVILISVLIAFTALIPVIGAFIGLIIGSFFILMVSPVKMLTFIVTFFVVQQFEDKMIYPRTVGSSVGLPAIWVFFAVTLGGSLCGVVGMLIFIPITSTLYFLIKEDVIRRNRCIY